MFRKREFVGTNGPVSLCGSLDFFAAFSVAVFLLQTGCQDPGSRARGMSVVGPSLHDFGEHRQGKLLSHSFEIINNDNDRKEIVDLRSSCACLIAGKHDDFVGTVVEPGETVTIPVFFETRGIAPKSRGTIAVLYRQLTDDKSRKGKPASLQLGVSADISPDFKVSPTQIDFGEVDGVTNNTTCPVIEISAHALDSVEQLEIVSSGDNITIEEIDEHSGKSVRQFQVGLNVGGLLGSRTLSETISIRVDKKNSSVVLIPITAKYVSPLDVTPEFIVFAADQSGDSEIKISTSRPSRVSEIGISGGDHGVHAVQRDSGNNDQEHVICISVPASRAEIKHGTITATIEIEKETNEWFKHEIEVPFHLF